jgi:DNA-directed RNA polymerase subunit M/transcription elongation factor TFIIS
MNDETNWTSIDLYKKGFHIKKSYPKSIKLDKLSELIDKAIEKGFEPSWNSQTSEEHLDPTNKWPQTQERKEGCQHPEDSLEERTSQSEKNPNRKFMRCKNCNNFVRWSS